LRTSRCAQPLILGHPEIIPVSGAQRHPGNYDPPVQLLKIVVQGKENNKLQERIRPMKSKIDRTEQQIKQIEAQKESAHKAEAKIKR
jgi:hypothetical protein